MRGRSRIRTRGRTGSNSLLATATAQLGVAPLHYWDFTTNRALYNSVSIGAVTNTPGWSFTRASTGYAQMQSGLLVPFASGAPRITDRGLLMEQSRVNRCLQSQTMADANWTKTGTTVSANAYTAPDATATMDGITAVAGSSAHTLSGPVTYTAAVYSASAYVRYVNNRWFQLSMFDGTTTCTGSFDLLNGAVGAVSNAASAITSLGGGVYWVQITSNAALLAAAGTASYGMNLTDTATAEVWTAAGTEAVGVWGVQAEAGQMASSYIPTTAATATRQADVNSATLSGIAYPTTLYAKFERGPPPSTTYVPRFAAIDAGSVADQLYAALGSTFAGQYASAAASVNDGLSNAVPILAVGAIANTACRLQLNDMRMAWNGSALGSLDNAVALPANPTTIRFGLNSAANQQCHGYLRTVALINSPLNDAALLRATT